MEARHFEDSQNNNNNQHIANDDKMPKRDVSYEDVETNADILRSVLLKHFLPDDEINYIINHPKLKPLLENKFFLVMLGTCENFAGMETVLTELYRMIKVGPELSIQKTLGEVLTERYQDAKSLVKSIVNDPKVKQLKVNHFKHGMNGPAGVPGKPKQEDEYNKVEDNPMSGTFLAKPRYDTYTNTVTVRKKLKKVATPLLYKAGTFVGGVAAGVGYDESLQEAIAYIQLLIKHQKYPLEINLFGFSRGADTLLRLCNSLNDLYPDKMITINYFGIDPVPGPGRSDAIEARLIPKIVRECVICMPKDERRPEFENQDKTQTIVQDLSRTNVYHYILRGDHSHPTRTTTAKQGNHSPYLLTEVIEEFALKAGAQLERPLGYTRLNQDGTYERLDPDAYPRFSPPLSPKLQELHPGIDIEKANIQLACYTHQYLNKPFYKTLSRPLLGRFLDFVSRKRRFVKRKRDYFLHGEKVFQDKQHMLLFQQLYPNYFDYFFQKGVMLNEKYNNDTANAWKDVEADIAAIKDDPILAEFCRLRQLPLEVNNPETSLINYPKKRGIPVTTAIYQEKELMGLWEATLSAFNPITNGNNSSISKEEANDHIEEIYKILIDAKRTAEQKKVAIKVELKRIIFLYINKNFIMPLAGVINFSELEISEVLSSLYKDDRGTELTEIDPLFAALNQLNIGENELAGPDKTQYMKAKVAALNIAITSDPNLSDAAKKNMLHVLNVYTEYKMPLLADQAIRILNDYQLTTLSYNDYQITQALIKHLNEVIILGLGNNSAVIAKFIAKGKYYAENPGRLRSLLKTFQFQAGSTVSDNKLEVDKEKENAIVKSFKEFKQTGREIKHKHDFYPDDIKPLAKALDLFRIKNNTKSNSIDFAISTSLYLESIFKKVSNEQLSYAVLNIILVEAKRVKNLDPDLKGLIETLCANVEPKNMPSLSNEQIQQINNEAHSYDDNIRLIEAAGFNISLKTALLIGLGIIIGGGLVAAACFFFPPLAFFIGDGAWIAGPIATVLREDLLTHIYGCPIKRIEDHQTGKLAWHYLPTLIN